MTECFHILLLFVAVGVPMVVVAMAVVHLGRPQPAKPLFLRPKQSAAVKRDGWGRRLLRVLLMLALAAACAWLVTSCGETVAEGGGAVLTVVDGGLPLAVVPLSTIMKEVALFLGGLVLGYVACMACMRAAAAFGFWWRAPVVRNSGGRVRPTRTPPPPAVPACEDPLAACGPGLNDEEMGRILGAVLDELREARGQIAAVRLCLLPPDMDSAEVRADLDATGSVKERLGEALAAVEARHSMVISCVEGLRDQLPMRARREELPPLWPRHSLVEAFEGDSLPWCAACKSWHSVPRSKEHHAALMCFAPWEGGLE